MPRCEISFIDEPMDNGNVPTDEQLLLQLVYGLAGSIRSEREEKCPSFVNQDGIPNPYVRKLMRAIVTRCNLPIPIERVDEWVAWCRSNECEREYVGPDMSAEYDRLSTLAPN